MNWPCSACQPPLLCLLWLTYLIVLLCLEGLLSVSQVIISPFLPLSLSSELFTASSLALIQDDAISPEDLILNR